MESFVLPVLVERAGEHASRLFVEFLTSHIRSPNTRRLYAAAIDEFFCWCEERELELSGLQPAVLSSYFEELAQDRSPATVRQHFSALRGLMSYFVLGHVLPSNPARALRAPVARGPLEGS